MSFILDALKKSEAERQRQNAPGIANVPDARSGQTKHKWIWLVAILLTINLAALVAVLYLANSSSPEAVISTPVNIDPSDQSDTSFSEIVAEAKKTRRPTAQERPLPAPEPEVVSEPAQQPEPAGPTVSESYPTLNDLRASGDLALPEMHLDIHVFSGQPSERFVFINMTKYKENARLSEGPVVKQITPEGVILDYEGTDFLLPRE